MAFAGLSTAKRVTPASSRVAKTRPRQVITTIASRSSFVGPAPRLGATMSAHPPGLQTKLKIGEPNDRLEQEADRVADEVMRMPAPAVSATAAPPQISRKCAECEEEEGKLQRKAAGPLAGAGDAPATVHDLLRSPGQPLDAATRAFFEPRFGHDLGRVRVHSGAAAEQSARDVNAHAYTVGHDIVFGAGRFAPGTHEGWRLLAHELTHVVQQGAAPTVDAAAPCSRVSADANAAVQRQAKPSHHLEELARMAIRGLDDDEKKIVLSAVLNASKRSELPAFAAILRAKRHDTYGDYFIFLITELEEKWGSRLTVAILQAFADAGVEIAKLNYSLNPLAAVARFRSLVQRYKALLSAGKVREADRQRVGQLIAEAEMALRGIEGPPRKPGVQVQRAGAVAAAAGALWTTAGALAADDVTGIGVADDVAIPFVIIAAAALSAIALFTGGPKPQILDYGPAKAKIDAALLAIAAAVDVAVQVPRPVPPPAPPRAPARESQRPAPRPEPEPGPQTGRTVDIVPQPDQPKEEKRETCATVAPAKVLCATLPREYNASAANCFSAAAEGRKRLQTKETIPLTLGNSDVASSGPCVGKGGVHFNVMRGKFYIGAIVCCPCCEDTLQGPVQECRCGFVRKKGDARVLEPFP